MIFFGRPPVKGQVLVEFLVGTGLMILLSVSAVLLLIGFFGKIMAVRWAQENSRCIAQTGDANRCEWLVRCKLKNRFHFKEVDVTDQILRGIIHTQIKARVIGPIKINANYDLGPGEYKRVSQ